MYRELINSLTFMYSTICRGKGIVKDHQLQNIAIGAHSLTATTKSFSEQQPESLSANEQALIKEAEKIDEQIEEIYVFLNSLEII